VAAVVVYTFALRILQETPSFVAIGDLSEKAQIIICCIDELISGLH
jgi:hypothetical protein